MIPPLYNRLSGIELRNELIKCKQDPVYFIDNYISRDEVGGRSKFDMYDAQKELVRSLLNDHYVIVLKSRQIGISSIVQAYLVWILIFNSNITCAVISRDSSASTDFTRRCKLMLDNLPEVIRPKYKKNIEQHVELKNNSRLISTQVRPSSPESVLRGETVTFLVIDEAAFIEKIEKAYTGMAPSITTAANIAESKGFPFGVAILSTPNGTQNIGKWYYDMWVDANNSKNLFKPIKIHYSSAPFADEKWVETNKKLLGYNQLLIDQELELKFVSSQDSFFEPDIIQALNSSKDTNCKLEVIPYFDSRGNKTGSVSRRVFEEVNDNNFYLIGVDISSSYSDCNSAIQVVRYPDLVQVEEFVGKLTIPKLKEEIINLTKKYNNSLLIIENNSYGTQLTQELSEMDDVSDKLYYTKVLDSTGKVTKLIPGLNTNAKTKPLMMESLYWTIKENPKRVKSEILILELIGLRNNLKSDSLTDTLMAISFTYYVSKYDSDSINYHQNIDINAKDTIDKLFGINIDKDKEYIENLKKSMSKKLPGLI